MVDALAFVDLADRVKGERYTKGRTGARTVAPGDTEEEADS